MAGNHNSGRRSHVTDEELCAAFSVLGSYAAVGRLYGLTRERIRKRLTAVGVRSDAHGPTTIAPPLKRTCPVCGEVFYTQGTQTCSPACGGILRRRHTPEELLAALQAHGMNKRRTAQALGISVVTFYRLLPDVRRPRKR